MNTQEFDKWFDSLTKKEQEEYYADIQADYYVSQFKEYYY